MLTPYTIETVDTTSIPLMYLENKLILENFIKLVKAKKTFEQLNVWSNEFKPFMYEIIEKALKTYEKLHTRMDDIEE